MRHETLPDKGKVWVVHPDDVNLKLQLLMDLQDVDYMLDAHVPRGQAFLLDLDQILGYERLRYEYQ